MVPLHVIAKWELNVRLALSANHTRRVELATEFVFSSAHDVCSQLALDND